KPNSDLSAKVERKSYQDSVDLRPVMILSEKTAARVRVVLALLVMSAAGGVSFADESDFGRDIAPLLIRNCLGCHNGSDPAGGLDLTRAKLANQAGQSGQPAIVAGHSEESYLLARVRDGEMPPEGKGKPLSEKDIDVLRRWIEAGAAWPEERVLSPF